MDLIVRFLPFFGVLALFFVVIKSGWVSKQDVGDANPPVGQESYLIIHFDYA